MRERRWGQLGARAKARIIQRKADQFKRLHGRRYQALWGNFASDLVLDYNYPIEAAIILAKHHLGVKDDGGIPSAGEQSQRAQAEGQSQGRRDGDNEPEPLATEFGAKPDNKSDGQLP